MPTTNNPYISEKRLLGQIDLQRTLKGVYDALKEELEKESKEYGQLNRDLLVTEINSLLALIGAVNIRVGVNAPVWSGKADAKADGGDEAKKAQAAEQEG